MAMEARGADHLASARWAAPAPIFADGDRAPAVLQRTAAEPGPAMLE